MHLINVASSHYPQAEMRKGGQRSADRMYFLHQHQQIYIIIKVAVFRFNYLTLTSGNLSDLTRHD